MSFELERGSILGGYELLVRIGRGGMASVWVARGRPSPKEPEQLVAIKAMLPELATNMEFRSMFLDEGQIVRSIDHPNVVRVYDVDEVKGVLFMAMEWVEGDSLHTLIAEANKRRPIPPEVAVRLIADTAAGLHAAHELRGWDGKLREVVHCDVSPHNILIGLDGVVKLVDFGVAGAMNQISADDEVKIRGKFGYMSPEQAQAKPLDRRSDVFSLGIVLFELTTGYRLFRGRDDRHTLELVTFGKIPKPSQVMSRYPEKLEAIVMKALERDLDRRFQTADEFRDALETYLVEERILVPAAGVKGLLRKVLGGKIDQRRQQIRSALRTLDGSQVIPTLVSEESLVPDEPVSVSVSANESLSNPSFTGSSSSSSPSSSSSLGAAFLPGDGSSGVQTLSQPSGPPARPNRYLLIGAALGVALAGLVFMLLSLRPKEPEVREGLATGSQAPVSATDKRPSREQRKGSSGQLEPQRGLSLDSLPEDPGAMAPQPGVIPQAPPAAPAHRSAEQLARDMEALRAQSAAEAPKVTLDEENDADRMKAIANSVSLDDAKSKAATPPASAAGGEFDRASAQAALGRASNLAGMCRRPGGATGSSRAVVTFGPSGRAESVGIEGAIAGTPVADCAAQKFRSARVPAFSGSPVTVSKGFVIPD